MAPVSNQGWLLHKYRRSFTGFRAIIRPMAKSRRRDAWIRSGRHIASSTSVTALPRLVDLVHMRTPIMQRPGGDCGQKHEAGDATKPIRR